MQHPDVVHRKIVVKGSDFQVGDIINVNGITYKVTHFFTTSTNVTHLELRSLTLLEVMEIDVPIRIIQGTSPKIAPKIGRKNAPWKF
jgi:hypothetical protein